MSALGRRAFLQLLAAAPIAALVPWRPPTVATAAGVVRRGLPPCGWVVLMSNPTGPDWISVYFRRDVAEAVGLPAALFKEAGYE